ncbi:hypothetical protein IAR50_005820 [Cryptococcus sp. DSM 104548]
MPPGATMTSSAPPVFDFYNNPHGAIGQPSPIIPDGRSPPSIDSTPMATLPPGMSRSQYGQQPPSKTPAHGERGDVSHPRPDEEAWDRITLSAHIQSQEWGSPNPVPTGGLGQKQAVVPGYQPFIDRVASPLSSPAHRAPQNVYSILSPTHAPPTPTHRPASSSGITHHLDALRGLLGPLMADAEQVQKLKKEVEMWKGEWSKGERDRRELEERIGVLEVERSGKKPFGPVFTAVLIDGDGLIFQDSYLQAGFPGGQLAARHLLTSLPNLSPSPPDSGEEITLDINGLRINDDDEKAGGGNGVVDDTGAKEVKSVIVQVFLNKAGLGGALLKAGIIPSWIVYEQFWQGFSSSHELFTVCDVGPEYLKLYSRNAQCESIILGASHDNGYANVLSSLNTESRLSKLLLLKGYNTLAHQLRAYSSRVVSIPDLFRQEKVPYVHSVAVPLKDKEKAEKKEHEKAKEPPRAQTVEKKVVPGSISFSSMVAASSKPSTLSQPLTIGYIKHTQKNPVANPNPIPVPPSPSYSSDESGDDEMKVYDWGSRVVPSKASDTPEKFGAAKVQPPWKKKQADLIALASSKPSSPSPPVASTNNNKKYSAVAENGSSAGGWEKVGKKQAATKSGKVVSGAKGDVWENDKKSIKKRKEAQDFVRSLNPRPCHTYYLGAKGCTNDNCHYGHSYSLAPLHLEELARLAKCIMCPYVKGGKCKYGDEDCVYGHRCPNPGACVL